MNSSSNDPNDPKGGCYLFPFFVATTSHRIDGFTHIWLMRMCLFYTNAGCNQWIDDKFFRHSS